MEVSILRSSVELGEIFDGTSDTIFSVDKNWIITRANSQYPRVGDNFLDQYPHFNCYQAMLERVEVKFEDYNEPKAVWTSVKVCPKSDGGLNVFLRDITDKKSLSLARQEVELEKQKFEAIFNDAPAAMNLVRGPSFIFEQVNPQYEELIGGRELVGKPLFEAMPELQGQPFHALMTKVFETGKPFIGKEIPAMLIRRPGGVPEKTFFDFSYSRINDGDGKPYGIFTHAIDITSKVMGLRARDEFLSVASHELKTPLTSLKLKAQTHLRAVKRNDPLAYVPGRVDDLVLQTDKHVNRLNRIIDDMLDVSHIRAGKLKIEREHINLTCLVSDVLNKLQDEFLMAGYEMPVLSFEGDTEGEWDKLRIEQVIMNLLSNAIRYGNQKSVGIAIKGMEGSVRIDVVDHGIGISIQSQEIIFDRFERAVSANEVSGLGLGLFITKQIVLAHNGTINVQSELGQGSHFIVELPC